MVVYCILSILIFEDREVYLHMGPVILVLSPTLGMTGPSDLSDMDDINEAINNELLSLSNPRSGEGDGNQGGESLWSLQCLLQS